MIESLIGDMTCSWVRIVNGIKKYVTETTHVEKIGEKCTGKLVAKARPRQTSNSTLSPVCIPYHERKWIDVEPGTFDRNCLEVSKLMIRLLRHDDTVHRKEDGAVRFEDLASVFRSRNASISHWSIVKKRFQYCVNHSSPGHFLYLRAIQGHSGGVHVHPTLQDNVLVADDFAEHIYHVGELSRLTLYHPVWVDSGW